METLPLECLYNLFSFLKNDDLMKIRLVNHTCEKVSIFVLKNRWNKLKTYHATYLELVNAQILQVGPTDALNASRETLTLNMSIILWDSHMDIERFYVPARILDTWEAVYGAINDIILGNNISDNVQLLRVRTEEMSRLTHNFWRNR